MTLPARVVIEFDTPTTPKSTAGVRRIPFRLDFSKEVARGVIGARDDARRHDWIA
jgi:hypothetical protein